MFYTAAQLLKQRHGSGDIGVCAANKAEQLAFFRRHGASADRAFDKGRALLRHRGADGYHGFRPHRAHIDDELAGEFGLQKAVGRAVNRFGRGFVFAGLRFHTPTSCPTAINRCAIAAPIRPVPQTPIFIFLPSRMNCKGGFQGGLQGELLA
jgi:hypothetical protein